MQDMDDLEDQPFTFIGLPPIYGGFWIRLMAYIIDLLVLTIPNIMVLLILVFIFQIDVAQIKSFDNVSSCIIGFIWWIYFASFDSSEWQASIGKRAMGLKVVDAHGHRVSFGRATGRYFSTYLSGIILFIGYMMIGWNSHKRGLHDLIAKTYVIRVR